GTPPGRVRVYEQTAGNWTQVGSDLIGDGNMDLFGHAVSLSANGTRVAIGAPFNGDNGAEAGHVRVFEWSAGSWTQLGSDIQGGGPGEVAGFSVALSADGSRLIVGSPGHDSPAGRAQVFELIAGTWTQVGADIDGVGSEDLGTSVAISADGSQVAVGAPNHDSRAGTVRVYALTAGTWTQVGADIDAEGSTDLFGTSVSLSANATRVAVGAPENDGAAENAGHIRIFELNAGTWTPLGPDIDGQSAAAGFGQSVSLSADGSRVAAGGPFSNSNAGYAQAYQWTGSAWAQIGIDVAGQPPLDFAGYSVSLSGDGTYLGVGYTGHDSSRGTVRVFDLSTPLPVEWGSVTGVADGSTVVLNWSTLTETNNTGFAIERALGVAGAQVAGSGWEDVGFVAGAGTTAEPQTYRYRVEDLGAGTHRFRLKQIDADGAFSYSTVVEVALDVPAGLALDTVFPSPLRAGTDATVGFTLARTQQIQVVLYSALGQSVRTLFSGQVDEGRPQRFTVSTHGLGPGFYVVRVHGESVAGVTPLIVLQ
ncbi:MAG: hypothetical protein AAGI08_04290, partial [Bacteroidota bacterium]